LVITVEQAETINLKDELAPLRRLKEAKLGGADLSFERERLFNEELTDIAEAIDSHYLQSTFEYGFDGHHTVLPDGTALIDMYRRGTETAKLAALNRPQLQFECARRAYETQNQKLIDAMMRGELEVNTVIELSPYPDEAAELWGNRHMENMGYKPNLRRGMVRIAQKNKMGNLSLSTFSLDKSSLELFQHLQLTLGQKPDTTTSGVLANPALIQTELEPALLIAQLSGTYDEKLKKDTGRNHWRGRAEATDNSLDMLKSSQSIVDYYLGQLEVLSDAWANETVSRPLSRTITSILNYESQGQGLLPPELANELNSTLASGRLNENSVSIVKRALELSVWATIVNRLEHPEQAPLTASLNQMLGHAYQAEAQGQRMVGCGGATSLFSAGRAGALEQVFGGLFKIEARYSFNRRMHCVVCQQPPRRDPKTKRTEAQKWCGPCGICRGCDKQLKKKTK